jgi:glutamate-1-semialdehyde 2,1-aminomutase
VRALRARECERYTRDHPRSQALTAGAASGYYAGVPLHWMLDWPLPFPLVVANAQGAELRDVDGHQLADFCLGDTGSMFGHSPAPVVRALREQAGRGLTYMLPTEDTLAVGQLLCERFGLPHWQVATTASDANRFALRVARAATNRARILVMNGCYHGAVDETYVSLANGRARNNPGLIGQFADLTTGTEVVEFNDTAALERALAKGDIACVITEPVLTNCCMVQPVAGYHATLRALTPPALCCSSTRPTPSRPGRPVTAASMAWSRTSSCSANRSPAACRPASGVSPMPSPSAGIASVVTNRLVTRAWARRSRPTHSPWRRCGRP